MSGHLVRRVNFVGKMRHSVCIVEVEFPNIYERDLLDTGEYDEPVRSRLVMDRKEEDEDLPLFPPFFLQQRCVTVQLC